MNGSVHAHTPRLRAIDSRGLPVREVDYWRAEPGQGAERRVTLGRHDPTACQRMQWDARLFEGMGEGAQANQRQLSSLTGRALLDESADAGWQLQLVGDAGQTCERWDTRGSHWQTAYDTRVRPLWIREQAAQGTPRIAERFTYAVESGANGRGRLCRHDEEAGSRRVTGYSLNGEEQGETRHFLTTLDLPDWPEDPAARDALLEPGAGAGTTFVHGPLAGQCLESIDARGNRQVFRHALNGKLSSLTLCLADGTQQPIVSDIRYDAQAQVATQTAGNGVVSQAQFDSANGRLQRFSASRAGRSVLLDLHYHYDPLGNVLKIEDYSQAVVHFANQRVDPVSTFRYDSLCQLIEARGREAAGVLAGPGLPELAPDPGDTSRLLNYHECYGYDASGNLLSLRHSGQACWTRTFNVAADSNRALLAPGDPAQGFDANGNLRELALGQPLQWSARDQLHGTRQVARAQAGDDEEHYRYGGDGQRLRKVVSRRVAGRMQHSETRYLPGLELHTRQGEAFVVVTTPDCRCLYWSEGPPDGIEGRQWRYCLRDLHDSSGLELDGEARIISHEGYYPFGGTAWWAGRSVVEADYKTHRYSGRERDGSGLYDYGQRYYAPWLARWINPDPAGDVDGLNRYRMARNNPLTLKDEHGLMPMDKQVLEAERERRRAFVGEHFDHKFPRWYVVASSFVGADGRNNEFSSTFEKNTWTLDRLYRLSKADKRFFTSDVLHAQVQLAKERYGVSESKLQTVKFQNVVNPATVQAVSGLVGGSNELKQAFSATPLGRLTERFLDELGLASGGISVRPIDRTEDGLRAADIFIDVVHPESSATATPLLAAGEVERVAEGMSELAVETEARRHARPAPAMAIRSGFSASMQRMAALRARLDSD
ncbi:RHS repeat-associated core domain-containing protein [Pseudomonas wadenswilerensis]